MSEANLRDYLASVFTNIEHGSSQTLRPLLPFLTCIYMPFC